jgi:hypothetical protein
VTAPAVQILGAVYVPGMLTGWSVVGLLRRPGVSDPPIVALETASEVRDCVAFLLLVHLKVSLPP